MAMVWVDPWRMCKVPHTINFSKLPFALRKRDIDHTVYSCISHVYAIQYRNFESYWHL